MSVKKSKGSVWDDLIDDPVERELLRIKSQLSIEIIDYIEKHKLTQKEASDRMGVTRSRISNAVTGKLDSFTIDMLVSMLERVGISPLRKVG
ncbi:XRE family transcriptional regulator [Granulosicoccus sp.]|nr:XRE family transcriptional regulator [Granulosicoccus sp.]